ncbi:MAG: hypothetical protein RLZZ156_1610 [Deinococcota bacterium]
MGVNEVPNLDLTKILRGGGDVSSEGETSLLEYTVPTTHGIQTNVVPLLGSADWRAIASHVSDNEYWLAGTIRATLNLDCGRCLDPVSYDLEARLESLLRFDSKIETPTRLVDNDEEVIVFGNPIIDLTALFAEALSLEIPAMVKCKSKCKGLCVDCGANLNRTTACTTARADCPVFGEQADKRENPFAALKDLFKD